MEEPQVRSDHPGHFFDVAPDLLCVADFSGHLTAVNPVWEQTFGLPVQTFLETPWIKFVHPDDRVRSMAESIRLRTERTCFNFVNRHLCSDGSYRWLSWNARSNARTEQIYGIGRDITDTGWAERYLANPLNLDVEGQIDTRTKQWQEAVMQLKRQLAARDIADEALRDTHQLLHSIITACPHAVIAVDADRNVRLWNPAATRIFGWTEDDTLGNRVPFVAEAQRAQSDDFNRRALAGEMFSNFEVQRIRRDGMKLDLLVSAAPTLSASGSVDGFLTIATDITEFKKLEQQLLRTQRLQGLGTLASGIAHDLNNVLAPIGMALELLRMNSSDADTHRSIDMMTGCVKRGSGLIRQVLTFARGVQGERVPIQTRHLLNDTERVLSQTMNKAITIRADVPRDLWVVVADATQIHQVLMNLCVNARDAMPNGGVLTMNAQNVVLDEAYVKMSRQGNPGPYVMVEIKDDGVGIPEDVRDRIFEPFFTTKEAVAGTGLGLSTVAAIVKNHGGFISLYSEVGRGTSFKVYLPAVPSGSEQTTAAEAETPPLGNGELILIVDDEAAIRDISKVILEEHGYTVVTAEDGAEGVAAYAQHRDRIRLIISDMDMPVMNGAAMMRSIGKINPDVRVIASSGLAAAPASGAIQAKRVFRLPKPYTAMQLLQTVRHMIDLI
jgi:two-component system cell cycle sensor histidine kinase/response regulator CckA